MNYEIDLRSREYLSREHFLKKRSLLTFLLILFLVSPFFFYYGLNYYHLLLVKQFTTLEEEVNTLRREAEPLLIIASDLEDIASRKQLIDEIKPAPKKWSAGLHLLHDTAPAQITITRIEIASGGTIKIDGASSNLHAPARYRQNLLNLPAFEQTELNIMTLKADQNYTFKITTRLSTGDDLDDTIEKYTAQ